MLEMTGDWGRTMRLQNQGIVDAVNELELGMNEIIQVVE